MLKKFAVFTVVAALMLFVAVPGFAEIEPPTVIDPGSLTGDSDILVGRFAFGVEACCSDDAIDLELTEEGDFNWDINSDVDGMFVRTTEDSGSVSGPFNIFNIDSVDITYDIYSEDFFGFDVDSLNQNVSFDPIVESLDNSNTLIASWDFSGLDNSRFVVNQILATIGSSDYGFTIGALKIDETPCYTVALVAEDPSEVDLQPYEYVNSRIMGINKLDSFEDGQIFTYKEGEEDYQLRILIQNWGKDELVLESGTGTFENLIADDFIGLTSLNNLGVSFPLFPLDVKNSNKIGSGTTFSIIPWNGEDGAYTIGELNGSFDISFGDKGTLSISLTEEDNSVPTNSSGGGCSVGFIAPSALLLMLPLLFLNRK